MDPVSAAIQLGSMTDTSSPTSTGLHGSLGNWGLWWSWPRKYADHRMSDVTEKEAWVTGVLEVTGSPSFGHTASQASGGQSGTRSTRTSDPTVPVILTPLPAGLLDGPSF